MSGESPPAEGSSPRDDLGKLTSLAVGVVIVVALYVGRGVLVPLALAVLLSFILAPLVRLLRRVGLGRVPAVVLAVVLALGVFTLLGGLIGIQVSQLASDIPRYASTIDLKIANARATVTKQMADVAGKLGRQIQQLSDGPAPPAAGLARGAPAPKTMPVEIHQPDPTSTEIAERILAPVVSPVATAGIVFVVAIFILLQQADLRDRFIRLFGLQDLHRTTRALDDTARRLSRYLLALLGLNAFFGVIIGLGLLLIGVPNPLLWGTLAALFRFVPYIGSVLAALLPVTLAAAVDPGWGMAMSTAALFIVVEAVMGQFADPLVQGRSTGLSPISVVIAAIFWAWMWGPIGLILSTPLTVCLVVLGRHVQRLEFLDILMGNRPALTPVESFYQRILANDPDEVLEYAEGLLKDRSLSTYYDEVAIEGLHRAANDVERGVISAQQVARIREAVNGLVAELDSFDDMVPDTAKPRTNVTSGVTTPEEKEVVAPDASEPIDPEGSELAGMWSSAAPVLCIAGGGPFDEAVADMLMQLLGKNGLGARVVSFGAASREAIATLETSNVTIVCICYLDVSLNPSQLRYLVRRVRRALPMAPVMAGLWPREEAQTSAGRMHAAVDADHYIGSLREGVNTCLALARSARSADVPAQLPAIAAAPSA